MKGHLPRTILKTPFPFDAPFGTRDNDPLAIRVGSLCVIFLFLCSFRYLWTTRGFPQFLFQKRTFAPFVRGVSLRDLPLMRGWFSSSQAFHSCPPFSIRDSANPFF